MADIQGKGKVRLIARGGRYAESEYTTNLRRKVLSEGMPAESFGAIMGSGADFFKDKKTSDAAKEAAEVGRGDYWVEFEVTPDITESATATYYEEASIRGPASIMMYTGSPSRSFSISAKLVARNVTEAKKVSEQIHRLKSWRMPESYEGGFAQKAPAVLLLQGYGKMFKDIPVVMTDLSIEFTSEFDYISIGESVIDDSPYASMSDEEYAKANGPEQGTGTVAPADSSLDTLEVTAKKLPPSTKITSAVPIIVPVSISLREVHNVDIFEEGVEDPFTGLSTFDILKYRNGNLGSW